MKRQHRFILLAFIIWANLKTSFSLPVPEDELDTSTRLLGSSVVTSVSVVTGSGKSGGSSLQSRKVVSGPELPASPAGLLRPDRFQFYTLNKDGEVVTKQMTEKEIQSLIAAGGGHLPTEIHETQMAGEVPSGGMKVADVVQNVQNVLKSELSKPTTVMASVPTIPGHANDEWSSILPAILSGDMESQSLSIPETEIITDVRPVNKPAAPVMKPILEASSSGSKLKSNASSVSPTKIPDSTKISGNKPTGTKDKPSVPENHLKKPVVADKGPQDSVSSGTHYEPISAYSTSKPSTSSEKLSSKPVRPSSSDPYSKISPLSSSEKPTVSQKPSKPVEPSKPEQKQKPQISVRPDPGTYEEKPLVSVGHDKLKKPFTPSYILLAEKQTQGPSRTTVTKKPTSFATSSKPSYSFRPEYPPVSYSEIPMIPVHVITADQVLTSTPQYQKENSPVFQVLNTISADALSGSNTSKIGIQGPTKDEETNKYPHPVYKPEKTSVQVPEKVASEQPTKPLPEIVFSDSSLYTKLPEFLTSSTRTETPDMVSVVSETHTASIKIPGYPEIPIPTGSSSKPVTTPKPETKTTISMQSSVKDTTVVSLNEEPTEVDKNSPVDKFSTSSASSTSGSTVASTSPADKEITTQKIFGFKATTTDLITDVTTDILETSTPNVIKEFETTTDYTFETSTVPVTEEIQFHKIPDMAADEQTISPETSAIEKIIETLHHPTESKFGTSTMIDIDTEATDLGAGSDFSTTFTILGEESSTPDFTTFASSQSTSETKSETTEGMASSIGSKIRTSTAPTLLSLENAADGTPKPYGPLPTDLADSLSSMISQISETMPSLLPVSPNSLLTEMPSAGDDKFNSTKLEIYQQNTESTRVTQGLSNFETTMYKNSDVDVGATVRLEDATETLDDVRMSSSSKPDLQTSTTSSTELKTESVKGDLVSDRPAELTTSSPASSSTAAPIRAAPTTASSLTTSSSTASFSTHSTSSTTASPSTAGTTESLKSASIPVVTTTIKLEESAQDQVPQSDESQKISSVNITEKPIIKVTVTESGSTNLPGVDDKDNTESPVIRIQASDAVSIINNLLESAPSQTTASYVTLNLPEGENNSPNNIGSSLVAGFSTGSETAFGPSKPPIQNDLIIYSNTSPSSEIKLEDTKSPENKTEEVESKTGDVEDKTEVIIEKVKDSNVKTQEIKDVEDSIVKTQENKNIVEVTKEKVENVQEENKKSEEKIEDNVKDIEEIKSSSQNTTKVDVETKTADDKVKSSPMPEEEPTTQKYLIISTSNTDKMESTTEDFGKIQTGSTSTESRPSNTKIETSTKDSVSSPLPKITTEEKISTSDVSTILETTTKFSIEENQTKASSADQSTTESTVTQKEAENIQVKNTTQSPIFVGSSITTKANETKTSASEKLETIVFTTPEPTTKAVITTPKSNTETVVTTSESNTETVNTTPKTNAETVITTPKSNTETIITTPKSSTESVITTPKSTTEAVITTPESNVEIVVSTPKSKITSPEPIGTVLQNTNRTRKPETPVVRIDISPETNQPELLPKTQPTALPISDKVTSMESDAPVGLISNVSVSNEKLSSDNIKLSISGSIDSGAIKNDTLSYDEKQKKVDTISEASLEQSLKNNSIAEGQEVRIRVNSTAVLVSKKPSPIVVNETQSGGVDVGSKVSPISIKEQQVKKTDDEIDLKPSEGSKNTSDYLKEQTKPVVTTILELKDEQSLNDTKQVIANATLGSEKYKEDKIQNEFKPNLKPETEKPSLSQKEKIDPTKESAYNKLGEYGSTSTEATRTKPSETKPLSSQKKNVTSTITKPGSSGHKQTKPTGAVKPSIGSSTTKPGTSSMKPNLPSKNRPSSHEPVSFKPTEPTEFKKPDEDKWALIPQPSISSSTGIPKPTASTVNVSVKESPRPQAQRPQVALDASQSAIGLDGSIANLDPDIVYFSNLCNELAFSFWSAANKGLSTSRSLALSPFGMTSMLAMVFLGARGPTSNEMNDVLKLDDVTTFNPHLVFQNVTDQVSLARRQGIANAAFVRELFADRSKVGKLMPFYKEQAQQFYEGFVEEVNFAAISDIVRRRTNLLVRKQTGGKIRDFVRTNTVGLRPPLAALSANVFQTECNSSAASSEGRDGELYFAVSPAVRQRELVPVPATVWKSGVLAGYEASLDATVIALGGMEKLVSTIFVIPGQQGHMAPGDNLDNLEVRLVKGAQQDGAWEKLLKVLIPRTSLELQVPKFSHRSIINATAALKRMGLGELFSKHADLKGINGIGHDLHLADVLQMNLFSTCGDEVISNGRHHVEIYPGPPMRNYRKMSDYDEDLDAPDDGDSYPGSEGPLSEFSSAEDDFTGRSSRQTDFPEKPRLKLDRPFLYFVRHNPTGLILHMGRFNPRLLP